MGKRRSRSRSKRNRHILYRLRDPSSLHHLASTGVHCIPTSLSGSGFWEASSTELPAALLLLLVLI